MKYLRKIVILVLTFTLVVSCGCVPENTANATTSADTKKNPSAVVTNNESPVDTIAAQKAKIVDMFMRYATRYDDGYYRFHKEDVLDGVYFGYTFSYNPKKDTFICSTIVDSYVSSYKLSDYGSVVFQWGNFKKGYFSGDHVFSYSSSQSVISSIEFEYSISKFNSNISLGNYKYNVISNSFPNLTSSEKAEYADTSFGCVEQGVLYAQSIIYKYYNDITLW